MNLTRTSSILRRTTTLAAALLALGGGLAACNAEAAPTPAPAPQAPSASAPAPAGAAAATPAPLPARDPVVARRLVEQEHALLIDVRTPGEYASGNVPGAVNIPVEALDQRLDEVKKLYGDDTSRAIVVYCRSGRRSGIARELLLKAGYARVVNFGGISEWN